MRGPSSRGRLTRGTAAMRSCWWRVGIRPSRTSFLQVCSVTSFLTFQVRMLILSPIDGKLYTHIREPTDIYLFDPFTGCANKVILHNLLFALSSDMASNVRTLQYMLDHPLHYRKCEPLPPRLAAPPIKKKGIVFFAYPPFVLSDIIVFLYTFHS